MPFTAMRIGHPAAIATASPTLAAIARLSRLVHVASARPMLAISAPWIKIVATRRAAPKSYAARDNLS
jgi:hypothetical protein